MTRQDRGWLKNPQRRDRQKKSLAFTDDHVQALTDKIDAISDYCSPTLGERIDKLLRLRDKAIISTGWIWFKRASEFLSIKRKDVTLTEKQILVTFRIKKKSKRFRICPECGTKSGFRSKFCRECTTDLQEVEIQGESEALQVTKRKTLKNSFVQHLKNWITVFDEITEEIPGIEEGWLFPSLQVQFSSAHFRFFYANPMTVQNLDRILQKLDSTLTSSFFRYFATEKYLTLGYTERELKEIGDWSSSRMPEIYAERRGITPAQRRFAEDTR